VSALDFLSTDRAVTDGGFAPVLKSSLERRQREAGAAFDERHGWLVPVSFPGEEAHLAAVGLVDLSHFGTIEVRGATEPVSEEGVLVSYRVRAGVDLVLCEPKDTFLVRSKLARRHAFVLDRTAGYATLAIVGPHAPDVLRRLTHLHELPASGPVAHVAAHVLERDGGYWIVFGQEYGHYLWEAAMDAAERFGGGPVGVDAIGGGAR
jgi:glycine cleavage system aminomethyltransferase T